MEKTTECGDPAFGVSREPGSSQLPDTIREKHYFGRGGWLSENQMSMNAGRDWQKRGELFVRHLDSICSLGFRGAKEWGAVVMCAERNADRHGVRKESDGVQGAADKAAR